MINKQEVLFAIKVAEAHGYKIVSGKYCDTKTKTCCALGAVAVASGLDDYDLKMMNIESVAADALGVCTGQTNGFMHGFDGARTELYLDQKVWNDAYKLGREIRNELGIE